jgi:hypothetical protein
LFVEGGHDFQSATECLDVGAKGSELGAIEVTSFDLTDTGLTYAQTLGDFRLGDVLTLPEFREVVRPDAILQMLPSLADGLFVETDGDGFGSHCAPVRSHVIYLLSSCPTATHVA